MQAYWSNVAFAREHGFPLPESPQHAGLIIAAYDKPSAALKEIDPQLIALLKAHNQPWVENEKINDLKAAAPALAGGLAENIDAIDVLHDQGKSYRVREVGRYESDRCGQGAWTLYGTAFSAPVDRFDAESLVMVGVLRSEKVDPKRLKEVFDDRLRQQTNLSEEMRKQQEEQFEAGQRNHEAQMAAFDQYNEHWKSQEAAKSASLEPFKEYIRGYADVQDSRLAKRVRSTPAI